MHSIYPTPNLSFARLEETACFPFNMASQDPEKHYRGASVGQALIETLDEMPAISPQLAEKIRHHFDDEVLIALRSQRMNRQRMRFKARCHIYRFYDDRWFFVLKDVKVKTDSGRSIRLDCVTIDAISSGLEEERRITKELNAASKSKRKRRSIEYL